MTDNIENLVLEHLRSIRVDMASMKDDIREIKSRVNTLEAGQATIIQQINWASYRNGCRAARLIRQV